MSGKSWKQWITQSNAKNSFLTLADPGFLGKDFPDSFPIRLLFRVPAIYLRKHKKQENFFGRIRIFAYICF